MDFVHDTLSNGRPFRILPVVDNWSRQSPILAAGLRMSEAMVRDALDRVLHGERGPRSITGDHGTEFQSRALEEWTIGEVCTSTAFGLANRWKTPSLNRFTDDCETSV
ncbi:MAG: hypothetical protein LZF86_170016 [Nitrospira sp.]|nr:MAG: hypothetical protein LZF86_170016 [Nitrospira sp.]